MHSGSGLLRYATTFLEILWVLGMHEIGQIATIVENQIEWLTVLEDEGLLYAPDVFFVGFTFPSVHWYPGFRYGRCRMILGAEYITGRPLYLWYKDSFVEV